MKKFLIAFGLLLIMYLRVLLSWLNGRIEKCINALDRQIAKLEPILEVEPETAKPETPKE